MIEIESVDSRPAVDYVLRTAQQNTVQLSAMADQKASVVLGSSFVVASIVFGALAGDGELDAPRVVLAVTALVSGTLAGLVLIPKVGWRPGGAHPNLLFFGAAAKLDREAYGREMTALLADDRRLYDAILDDLHQGARVLLRRKYRPLQASYAVLILGMLVTLLTALAAS